MAEAHLHGLHGAAAGAAADKARQEEQHAADDVAQDNGGKALGHAQWGEGGAGENLRQGDAGAEPDQSILKSGGLFHARSFPAAAKSVRGRSGYLCSHAMSQKEAS